MKHYTIEEQRRFVAEALRYESISKAHPNDRDDGSNADQAVLKALVTFARHANHCDELKHPAEDPPYVCTCGLAELLDTESIRFLVMR